MKALSLTQPWLSWAILRLGKRIENRDWPDCSYRGRLALHASKGVGTRAEFDDTVTGICMISGSDPPPDIATLDERREWVPSTELPRSAIVATCNLVGVIRVCDDRLQLFAPEPMRTIAKTNEQRRWHFGGFALVLDDVVTLREPVPCKGALGLWNVPADVAAEVERQRS